MTVIEECFAIVPDGQSTPAALFRELEDAMEWGLARYGGDRFTIKRFAYRESAAGEASAN